MPASLPNPLRDQARGTSRTLPLPRPASPLSVFLAEGVSLCLSSASRSAYLTSIDHLSEVCQLPMPCTPTSTLDTNILKAIPLPSLVPRVSSVATLSTDWVWRTNPQHHGGPCIDHPSQHEQDAPSSFPSVRRWVSATSRSLVTLVVLFSWYDAQNVPPPVILYLIVPPGIRSPKHPIHRGICAPLGHCLQPGRS